MGLTWYPGHMQRASRQIAERLRPVDLVIEVRDARIPVSSVSKGLEDVIRSKRRLVVLNKADLANPNMEQRVVDQFRSAGVPAVFASCTTRGSGKSARRLLGAVQDVLRGGGGSSADTQLAMVVGVPNCGKSSLINTMRGGSQVDVRKIRGGKGGARTGPLPGLTRHLAGFQVASQPSLFLLDTPGVMPPRIEDVETGMKLALTGAIKDTVVGEERVAAFLLSRLAAHSWGHRQGRGGTPTGMKQNRRSEQLTRELGKVLQPALATGLDWEAQLEVAMERLEILLGVLGAVEDESKRTVVAQQLLRLFRGGGLGRFTLDAIGAPPE